MSRQMQSQSSAVRQAAVLGHVIFQISGISSAVTRMVTPKMTAGRGKKEGGEQAPRVGCSGIR
jgi:hypothetical protein